MYCDKLLDVLEIPIGTGVEISSAVYEVIDKEKLQIIFKHLFMTQLIYNTYINYRNKKFN